MKKTLSVFILLLMLLSLCASARAETEAQQPLHADDTFTVTFAFSSDKAVYARIALDYDHDAFRFVSAAGGTVSPIDERSYYVLGNVGGIGTADLSVTLRVTHDALGDYTVAPRLIECYDIQYDDLTVPLAATAVTVAPIQADALGFGAYTPATETAAGTRGMVICLHCGKTLIAEKAIPAACTLTIPSSLTIVDAGSFTATAIRQAVIGEGVTTIADGAFAACQDLLLVILPDSITAIADDAFDGCDDVVFMCSAANQYVIGWAAAHDILVRTTN